MDSKRNWILVEASTSGSATPIHIRGSHRRSGPLMEHFRDEARLHTINRLNDRIHQRIMDNYRNGTTESTGEGAKVVDESFRFIDDEQNRLASSQIMNPEQPLSNISERLDSIISRRNSQGEVEAVYERRVPSTSSRDDILRPQSILRQPPPFEEPIYVKPAIRARVNHVNTSQAKPRMGLRRNGRDTRYRRTDSTPENVRYGRTEVISQYRRSDSLDSGSLRMQRQALPPKWPSYPDRYSYYGRFHGAEDGVREEWVEEPPRPTFLRRTPQFYDKCDLCAFKIMRTGDYCPACGRPGTGVRHDPQTIENGSYRPEEVLSAKKLSGYFPSDYMYKPSSKMYSTEFRKFYPTSHRIPSRRQTKSPVYRYGATVPKTMYDYNVWAKRQDRQALTMHAAILALVLFSTAFVVSAGVILLVTVT